MNCSGCGDAVHGACLTAFGMSWHSTCLACNVCGKDFSDGSTIHEGEDGFAYCQKDFVDTFVPKCGACGETVIGEVTNAMDRAWHPEHFVCGTCKKGFGGGAFYPGDDGVPYCEKHYYEAMGLLCAACQAPIVSGKCVTMLDKKYHPEHFKCSHCGKNLVGHPYQKQNMKPYCKECHIALFG